MKVIFAGTPDIATVPLQALLTSKHEVVAVYTQPDRPAGRGKKLMPSPVKTLALEKNIIVEQPENFKVEEARDKLKSYQADVMVVMAYGLILPTSILTAPKHGCINIHVSLLPRWRGAAPVQQAILAGDSETGVTIMQMDKGLDTGEILHQQSCVISEKDTSESVYAKLAEIASPLLLQTLNDIENNQLKPVVQNNDLATYAHKIEKQDAKIDWHETSETIDRKVRAYYPVPIAFFEWKNELVRIFSGYPLKNNDEKLPGNVIDFNKTGLTIKTQDSAYCITRLQFPGKNPLSAHEMFNAYKEKFHVK
ncbi:MAG: methionyl-tRNA formyltransferase [Pseudomonadota bacterium]